MEFKLFYDIILYKMSTIVLAYKIVKTLVFLPWIVMNSVKNKTTQVTKELIVFFNLGFLFTLSPVFEIFSFLSPKKVITLIK